MKLSSKFEDAKQHLQNARDIQNGWAAFMLEERAPLAEKLKDIDRDPHLSSEGRIAKRDQAKKEAGIEALKKMQTRKQQYVAELTKANKIADKVFYEKPKKPDPVTLERFQARLNEVKTKLALGSNEKASKAELSSFVASIKDPYLASLVRDDFLSLSHSIIGIADNAAVTKTEMAKIYEDLRDNFESDEVKASRDILEYTADQIENPKIANDAGAFEEKAVELFGQEVGRYIKTPEAYFAMNPDEKPEEYVDEQLEADRKAHEYEQEWSQTIDKISQTTASKVESGELNV